MEAYDRDEQMETVHIYVVREDASSVIDVEPGREATQAQRNRWGIAYCTFIGILFTLIPLATLLITSLLPPYDAVLSKTFSLTLSLHPTPGQVQLFQLPSITKTQQITAKATGSMQQPATRAEGLITFYNGLFTPQTVPAGTILTGKDGIGVVTSTPAVIPAATQTTPPTYGTVSVVAHSTQAGTTGNIEANDIDQACCGASILAQNLDVFSGGTNAQKVTVVTQNDLTNTTMMLKTEMEQETHDQTRSELPAEQQLVPLQCTTDTNANHQAGDQAQEVTITVSEQCLPLAYSVASVQQQVTILLTRVLPHTYRLISVVIHSLNATALDAHKGTVIITIQITAFVQIVHSIRNK